MSLKSLPQIELTPIAGLTSRIDERALASWVPEIQSATEAGDGAVISIYDEIGAGGFGDGITARRIAGALRSIGPNPIRVNINSPGGDFFEGVAIYNLLAMHEAEVTVKVVGLAASAASVIAMAGDKIEVSRVGFLMIHNAWVIAAGNKTDLREAADFLAPFDDAMASLYANQAGLDKSIIAEWMEEEKWFNGDEAVKSGLATGLLNSEQITEASTSASRAFLAERRAETALREGGLSVREAKTLIAQLKGKGRDDPDSDVTRDAGEKEMVGDLRSLVLTITGSRRPR